MTDETVTEEVALEDIRKAWDDHAVLVTRALDKIAKLNAMPGDNSAKIEEFVAKIKDSNANIGKVLDALDPPAPVEEPPVETPPAGDGGDSTPLPEDGSGDAGAA